MRSYTQLMVKNLPTMIELPKNLNQDFTLPIPTMYRNEA